MKLEEISGNREYTLKFSAHSITVKAPYINGGKTKGVIRDVTSLPNLPLRDQFDYRKTFKAIVEAIPGLKYGDFYLNNKKLYYLHSNRGNDFYENQINSCGSVICPDEYAKHLEHEKAVDDLRKSDKVTVIDYWPY